MLLKVYPSPPKNHYSSRCNNHGPNIGYDFRINHKVKIVYFQQDFPEPQCMNVYYQSPQGIYFLFCFPDLCATEPASFFDLRNIL